MAKIKRLLLLFVAVCLLAGGCGCTPFLSSPGGKSAPATTAVVTVEAQEDDLSRVDALFRDLFRDLQTANTTVVYDDPVVGAKLRASSTLTRDGDVLIYQAKVDRLNPADADRFTTSETPEPVVGTPEQIRENYSGLFFWDRVATGLILAAPSFSPERFDVPPVIALGDGERTLTARVPDGELANVFGVSLPDVSGMTVEVAYTETALLSLQLTYSVGEASMRVTVKYAY